MLVLGLFASSLVPAAANAAQGQITGSAFNDRNSNGQYDAGESGLEGVQVTAFGSEGQEAGTAVTSADGNYVLDVDTADDSVEVRLEFSTPDGYAPAPVGIDGATAGSTVQFVAPGKTADVGFVIPGQPADDNPPLVWAEQRAQATENTTNWIDPSTQRSIGSMLYGDRGDQRGATTEATVAQTGAIWGIANLGENHVASSALFKRHVITGPGGLGAIYLTDTAADPNASVFATIPNVGTDPRPLGSEAGPAAYDWFHDMAAWPEIGKIGLGGLAATPSFDALYAVNLNDKSLYQVPVDMSSGTPVAGEPAAIADLSSLPGASCASENVRPFGVSVHDGSVWVSGTCAGPTEADLRGYIFELALDGTLVGTGPVLEVPMDYERGTAFNVAPDPTANWHAWTDDPAAIWQGSTEEWIAYPQPLVSDIGFDENGDLTVAVKDRFGDQAGYQAGHPTDNTDDPYSSATAGELLRACATGDGSFALESNASCGGTTGAFPNNGIGVDGGEYYDDEFVDANGVRAHDQIALGAVLQIPGFVDFVGTGFDVGDAIWTNGFRFYENATGQYGGKDGNGWATINSSWTQDGGFTRDGSMGKASGLGDLDALVADHVEVGNRVWIDTDRDGVQDADEESVSGVVVTLTCGTTTATTTTNEDGEYYFNDSNVDGGLAQNVECSLHFETAGTTAEGLELTTELAGENTAIDSNAVLDEQGVPTIELVTPTSGANHTYDAGFVPAAEVCSIGDFVWVDENGNGVQDEGEAPVEGVTVTLLNADGTPVEGVEPLTTDANGLYVFSGIECGTYRVQFSDLPEGNTFTAPNAGEDEGVDSDPVPSEDDPTVGVTDEFTVGGEVPNDRTDVDAGIVPPAAEVCSIGDFVWVDENGNGVQDEGEAPVEGVTVTLLNADGTPVEGVEPLTTDANGLYVFSGIECGTYRVQFSDLPEGNTFTAPNAGEDEGVDSDPVPSEDDPTVGVTDEFTVGGEVPNDRTDVDAGIVPPAAEVCSIGDFVWVDENGNGVQDEGEAPVEGVTVTLLNADGTPVEGVEPLTTDANGLYVFSGIECGTYRVQFSDLPEGNTFTAPNAGEDEGVDSDPVPSEDDPTVGVTDEFTVGGEVPNDRTDVDAGIVPPAAEVCSIGDFVWYDLDKDGIQDEGEAGAEGVTVTLVNADGETVTTVETDVNGKYLFANIDCGTYTVTFEQPEGYNFTGTSEGDDSTIDSDPSEEGIVENVVVGGEEPNDRTDIDAGLVQPVVPVQKCTIGDFVWYDADKDGIQDAGEAAVPGVSVTLLDADSNPVAGVPAQITDAEGKYLFENLECGTYRVQFENLPEGTEFTTQTSGNDPAVDSNPNEQGLTDPVTVGGEQPAEDLTVDAGVIETEVLPDPDKCRIGDFVWFDVDKDGTQGADENGVPNVTVTLIDAQGQTVDTTTTNASGGYVFDEIECGTYKVRFSDIPEGTEFTTPNSGNDSTVDSNPNSDGLTDDIIVGGEEPNEDLTIDAGVVPQAPVEVCSIGDYVWVDENSNGVQDADEVGVEGVTVTLLDADGNPTGVAPVVTDENGMYVFSGIECGTYQVKFSDLPEGYVFTTPGEGEDSAKDSDPNTDGVVENVTVGGEVPNDRTDVDAGIVPPAAEVCSIGDFVWVDENGNGVQDEGEAPVEGVTVTLLNADGTPVEGVEPLTTDANGRYVFSGIECGTYQVKFSDLPEGYVFTMPGEGEDSAKDSDPNADGVVENVTVGGEEPNDRTDVDAGVVPPAPVEVCSIGDFVWVDANNNGVQDADEQGIKDVTVTLIDADGKVIAEVKTDAEGKYSFDEVECGTYQVKFSDLPEGYVFTMPGEGEDSAKDSDPNADGVVENVTVGGEEPNDRTDIDAGVSKQGTPQPKPEQPKPEQPKPETPKTPKLPETGVTAGLIAAGALGVLLAGLGTMLLRSRRKNS
ncbi:SdrD B-like domain-containing protein [Glutamicibacter endophyticus]|uniref:SdrD B-like domain-containing protein n=1 Tax=Glutamicibacter endophyticus TaxID=1522174 RepID=UPI003AEFAE7F